MPGAADVETLATGVSAHAELFELAAAEGAQLLLVHHGLFWGPGVRSVDPMLKRRLQILFDADIALAAYHLPLDAHPELGNNALLAQALGAEREGRSAIIAAQPIGCLARLPGEGIDLAEPQRARAAGDGARAARLRRGPAARAHARDRLGRRRGLPPGGRRGRSRRAAHGRGCRAHDGARAREPACT